MKATGGARQAGIPIIIQSIGPGVGGHRASQPVGSRVVPAVSAARPSYRIGGRARTQVDGDQDNSLPEGTPPLPTLLSSGEAR